MHYAGDAHCSNEKCKYRRDSGQIISETDSQGKKALENTFSRNVARCCNVARYCTNTSNKPKSNETHHYERDSSSNGQNQNLKTPRLQKLNCKINCMAMLHTRASCSFRALPSRAEHLNPTASVQKE